MLQFLYPDVNSWVPTELSESNILAIIEQCLTIDSDTNGEYLIIFQVKPYIDSIYTNRDLDNSAGLSVERFVFHDGYKWNREKELKFMELILKNKLIQYTPVINEIYKYYAERNPEWKLKPYYTEPMRLLDHIYHCMICGTPQEMLYKAGLDELAAHIDDIDDINLLSSRPSDIYGGITMRTLRSLNCSEGSRLLNTSDKRTFVKALQQKFPDIFKEKLNNAQCQYLNFLIDGGLTVGEAGRLFNARKSYLTLLWAPAQYQVFILKEKYYSELRKRKKELDDIAGIDPIYKDYIKKIKGSLEEKDKKIQLLKYYLLEQRENYDLKIMQSNNKRNQEWQERDHGYVIEYPQTINDFCRETIYMGNCLMTYIDAYIENDTTILFMRKTDNCKLPFITIEVFNNELVQAYHRFNRECTQEEKCWIREYSMRNGIGCSRFS